MESSFLLPVLPFGDKIALIDNNIDSLCQTAGAVLNGNWDIESLCENGTFQQKSAHVKINDLGMAALAFSPIRVQRDTVNYATLMFGVSGMVHYRVGKELLTQMAGKSAVLVSGIPRSAVSTEVASSVQIGLNPAVLARTLDAMGGEQSRYALRSEALSKDRQLPLMAGSLCFHEQMMSYLALVGRLIDHPHALQLLGLDDLIYRLIAGILVPDIFLPSPARAYAGNNRVTDMLCEFMMGHLNEPITLTMLEQLSGLSARTLQYSFQKRFGCSPMQWLRWQRLELAHHRLCYPIPGLTITEVALDCGFLHLGYFSHNYACRFGELPSKTLSRSLRRMP